MTVTVPPSLRALRHRNFRLFIAGQGTSHIGNWLQLVATSWLLYRLTNSPLMLGVASLALYGPLLLITPFAGVLLDRVNVRLVLLCTNTAALVQAVCMSVLVMSHWVEPWQLLAGNLVMGLVSACDMPARQSLLVRLVGGRDDLSSAIALNSIVMNGARCIGPVLGGVLIGSFGEGTGFGANSLLRFAVLGALLAMRFPSLAQVRSPSSWLTDLVTGMRYAYGFLPSRSLLLLLAATSITVHAYPTLMPWFAKERFHGTSQTLGLLLGAGSLGSVAGLVYLAGRSGIDGLMSLVGSTALLAGTALVAFSFATSLWLAAPMLFLVGMGMTLTAASTNTVLQSFVPDALRGRVASIYLMSFLGVSPLGGMINGWVSEHLGPPRALLFSGAAAVAAALVFRRQLKAIQTKSIDRAL